jgi:HK97 family phage portal protein
MTRDGGNYVQATWGPGKRLNYLLQVEPNPLMSASVLWEQVTIARLMEGNGFVYIERDDMGDPVRLWLADCAGYNELDGTYTLTFEGARGSGNRVEVPRSDVLHFPNTYRRTGSIFGMSTIRYAAETLSLIKTEKAQSLETAAKGGRAKLIIGEEKPANGQGTLAFGLMNKGEMNAYADEINERIYQKDVVALRGLDKIQNISMSAADMQLVEQLNMSQDDVARFYATPRPLLMMDSNSHYTTYTNATMEYLSRTIAPDSREMEDEMFRKLLSVDDFGKRRIHMCELPLLRMDKETQAKVDKARLESGTATINELRKEWDMPAVANGDEPMASANLMTLKALMAKNTNPAPQQELGKQE